MKHKYHPLKLFLSVVLSVLLLGTFGAKGVFANVYGQVDFPFQKVPMLYSTIDPDSGQLHFFFTENVLAKKMKSYELSEKAFSRYNDHQSGFDNVNITDDGEWIYSITYLENSDGIMEKRVARTSTKGLTGSLAHNRKKTEILDIVIASGTDLDKEPIFSYLADGSVLLFYQDRYSYKLYHIDDRGPALLSENVTYYGSSWDRSMRFIDENNLVIWVTNDTSKHSVRIDKISKGNKELPGFGISFFDNIFTRDYLFCEENGVIYRLDRTGGSKKIEADFKGDIEIICQISNDETYVQTSYEEDDRTLYNEYKVDGKGKTELVIEGASRMTRSGDLCIYSRKNEEGWNKLYYRFGSLAEAEADIYLQDRWMDLYRTGDGSAAVIENGDYLYACSTINNEIESFWKLDSDDRYAIGFDTLFYARRGTLSALKNGKVYEMRNYEGVPEYNDSFEINRDGSIGVYEGISGPVANPSEEYFYKDGEQIGHITKFNMTGLYLGNHKYICPIMDDDGNILVCLKDTSNDSYKPLIPLLYVFYFFPSYNPMIVTPRTMNG